MAAAQQEDLDHLISNDSPDAKPKKSGGVAQRAAAFNGGGSSSPLAAVERARAAKSASNKAAAKGNSQTPPAPVETSPEARRPAANSDSSEGSPSQALVPGSEASPQRPSSPPSSPETAAKPSPQVREAKGFLLSARRAPTAAEEETTAEAAEAEEPAESNLEQAAVKESATTLSGNARPNKRQGIGKNVDGTPRKASLTPKSSTKAAKAVKASDKADPEQRDDRPMVGPMISRRPGASGDLLPNAPTPDLLSSVAPASGQPEPVAQLEWRQQQSSPQQMTTPPRPVPRPAPPVEDDEEDMMYSSVPATWQDSLSPQPAGGTNSNEVNVTVKSPKQSRLSRLTGSRKPKKVSRFVPKARLAYYGTIGGGFGTPRLGFAAGQFNTPTWMATQASGDLVVSSTFAHEVQVLSPRGGPAAVISSFHEEHLHDPQGIAIDGDHMYISDGGNGRVLKFTQSKQGVWVPALSSKPGLLDLPQGLALDDGLLFVVCGRMDRIHVLDANKLTRLFSFGHDKPDRKQNLSDPTCISVYYPPESGTIQGVLGGRARKLLYVTDTEADRLAVFNMDGDFVAAIGSNGRDPGFFIEPLGISIRDEQVFVAEGGRGLGGRLQILKPDGTPLLVLPAPTGGRLVGVHWHDTRLYVSEIEAHRLHAFKIIA